LKHRGSVRQHVSRTPHETEGRAYMALVVVSTPPQFVRSGVRVIAPGNGWLRGLRVVREEAATAGSLVRQAPAAIVERSMSSDLSSCHRRVPTTVLGRWSRSIPPVGAIGVLSAPLGSRETVESPETERSSAVCVAPGSGRLIGKPPAQSGHTGSSPVRSRYLADASCVRSRASFGRSHTSSSIPLGPRIRATLGAVAPGLYIGRRANAPAVSGVVSTERRYPERCLPSGQHTASVLLRTSEFWADGDSQLEGGRHRWR